MNTNYVEVPISCNLKRDITSVTIYVYFAQPTLLLKELKRNDAFKNMMENR